MAEKEYIEAKDLEDFSDEIIDRFLSLANYNAYNKLTLLRIGETIDEVFNKYTSKPLADVVEVKHGEWIEDAYIDSPCVCSFCGEEALCESTFKETFDYDWEEKLVSTGYEEIKEYIRTPYCPNCGAKMDGKDGAE